jgi:hypothetical protein
VGHKAQTAEFEDKLARCRGRSTKNVDDFAGKASAGTRFALFSATRQTMKYKVKLALHKLSVSEIAQMGQTIVDKMTGNPDVPNPPVPLAQLQADLTNAKQAIQETRDLFNAYKAALSKRDKLVAVLGNDLTAEAMYVETVSGGNKKVILGAGMRVRNDRAPVTMPQVMNLRLQPSDNEGEVLARWKPIKGVRIYKVQICKDIAAAPTNWEEKRPETKTKCALNHDLVSGQKVWVRVRAVGARNEGPWSDVACKTVP